MNTPNDGGPAFPSATPATKKLYQPTGQVYGEEQLLQYYGMTLRDYFAGQALAGMCVGLVGELKSGGRSEVSAYAHGPCNSVLSERAYAAAAAIDAARSQEGSK